MRRIPWQLLLPCVIFGILQGWLSRRIGTWHEEVSVFPHRAATVLREGKRDTDPIEILQNCGSPDAPDFLFSSTRPLLAWCHEGRAFPVMVDSYMGGWPFWSFAFALDPFGRDPFTYRHSGLLIGIATLLLLHRLLRRAAGDRLAFTAVLLVAVSPPFVSLHALHVHYETLPLFALLAAMAVLAGCRGLSRGHESMDEDSNHALSPVSTGRLVLAASLVGLAFAGNVKTVFLVLPLLTMLRWVRIRWEAIRPYQWSAMLAAVMVPLLPMIFFAAFDPREALDAQVQKRLAVLQDIDLSTLAKDLVGLSLYWTDLYRFTDLIRGEDPSLHPLWIALPHLVTAIGLWSFPDSRSPDGTRVVAFVAALFVLTFYLVSVFLYPGDVRVNYSPITPVFGVLVAGVVEILLGRLAISWDRHRGSLRSALVVLVTVAWTVPMWARHFDGKALFFPTSAATQRSVATYLCDHPTTGVTLVGTYNLENVLDAVGGSCSTTIQVRFFFKPCKAKRNVQDCLTARWKRLLERPDWSDVRLVFPDEFLRIDERWSRHLVPSLQRAARELGRTWELERSFRTLPHETGLTIWRTRIPDTTTQTAIDPEPSPFRGPRIVPGQEARFPSAPDDEIGRSFGTAPRGDPATLTVPVAGRCPPGRPEPSHGLPWPDPPDRAWDSRGPTAGDPARRDGSDSDGVRPVDKAHPNRSGSNR